MTTNAASLRLAPAQGTTRYFLGDRVLQGGDIVELCCSGGWLTGRFEWDPGMAGAPSFHFSIELDGGGVSQQVVPIPDRAVLRWADRTTG